MQTLSDTAPATKARIWPRLRQQKIQERVAEQHSITCGCVVVDTLKMNLFFYCIMGSQEEGNKTGREIEEAIQRALELAERNGVQGRDLTPFLLSQVNRLTGGLSLKANKHLIENNVRSASGIAIRLAQLRRQTGNSSKKETM